MTLEMIAKACCGELHGNTVGEKEASCVVIDSRKMEKDGIFIATRGERVDGHDFIPRVAEEGALGVVCEKEPEVETKIKMASLGATLIKWDVVRLEVDL